MTANSLSITVLAHNGNELTFAFEDGPVAYDQLINGQTIRTVGHFDEDEYVGNYGTTIPYSNVIMATVERSSETVEKPEDTFCAPVE